MPTGPEWLATDPEHSYLFCRGQTCWQLIVTAMRPLGVLYFNGRRCRMGKFHSLNLSVVLTGSLQYNGLAGCSCLW